MAILEWQFALLNLLVLSIVLTAIATIFNRQLKIQEDLQFERGGRRARPARRHGERIRAAEFGGLISAGGMIALLASLLYLSYVGNMSVSNTLIIFFGTRLQNSAITSGSRSLMRYARAKAGIVSNGDEDE